MTAGSVTATLVGNHQRRGDGLQQVADRGAGQRQRHRGRSAAAEGTDREHRQRAQQRAGKAEPDKAQQRGDAEGVDRQDHGQRRALRDTEDAGIGDRIAGVALHQRARQAQRRAREDTDHGARHPELADDQVVFGAGGREQPVPHVLQRNRLCADRHAEHAADHENAQQDRDADDPAAATLSQAGTAGGR
jgi:hypothetical protein